MVMVTVTVQRSTRPPRANTPGRICSPGHELPPSSRVLTCACQGRPARPMEQSNSAEWTKKSRCNLQRWGKTQSVLPRCLRFLPGGGGGQPRDLHSGEASGRMRLFQVRSIGEGASGARAKPLAWLQCRWVQGQMGAWAWLRVGSGDSRIYSAALSF